LPFFSLFFSARYAKKKSIDYFLLFGEYLIIGEKIKKIDYKKEYKNLYKPSAKKCEIVDVPEFQFLMIDGKGNPNISQEYKNAVEALFSVSYTLKFMIKKSKKEIDYAVMPMQGLWWAEDMKAFNQGRKDEWLWTMMIMQPDFITEDDINSAIEAAKRKKDLPLIDKLYFKKLKEGKAAQVMHIGPFSEEGSTIEKLHSFIEESGYDRTGNHHEIYLSDIRKAAPSKWKTVLRQPIIKE
jgi:hypothetical protein